MVRFFHGFVHYCHFLRHVQDPFLDRSSSGKGRGPERREECESGFPHPRSPPTFGGTPMHECARGKKKGSSMGKRRSRTCVHARSTHFQRGSKQQNKMCRKDSKITFLCDITCKNSFSTEFWGGILKVLQFRFFFIKNFSRLVKRRISCAQRTLIWPLPFSHSDRGGPGDIRGFFFCFVMTAQLPQGKDEGRVFLVPCNNSPDVSTVQGARKVSVKPAQDVKTDCSSTREWKVHFMEHLPIIWYRYLPFTIPNVPPRFWRCFLVFPKTL